MPVIGRRPALAILPSGETLTVISEAAQYSIPAFYLNSPVADKYLVQDNIYALGTRLAYSIISIDGISTPPVPVLCLHQSAENGAQPLSVFPLHNAVDISVISDPVQHIVHFFWWWNGWTPDYVVSPPSPSSPPPPLVTVKLPNPPTDWYASHSVPDPSTPAWLRSLVPKSNPSIFDSTKPFWVAPIPEGHQFDYFPDGSIQMGESRANGPPRMPDTPGARLLQSMIARALINYPGPAAAAFGAVPSDAREDWEQRGGIVAAGQHIAIASARDVPEFIPVVSQNPYTHEPDLAELPGVGQDLPDTVTWEDHLVIINSLKAHFDYANMVNSTRVLMYAKGYIFDGCTLETIPRKFTASTTPPQITEGPWWPSQNSESVITPAVLLNFPKVIGQFPNTTNYRTMINPDKVWYPFLDFPDIGTAIVTDGFLVDGSCPHQQQEPAVDWVISDPSDPASQLRDIYRNHLDNGSY